MHTITQAEGDARSVLPWGTPGTSGFASTTPGRRAPLRIPGRRLRCVFAGPGQRHLRTAAECALHPFSHPCSPWENTSLEQRRRGAVWHRGDGSSRKNHRSIVWRGDTALPSEDQRRADSGHTSRAPRLRPRTVGIVICDTRPVDHEGPHIARLQCAWMVLLYCCAVRANYTLRVVHPELTAGFAAHHDDASLRRCLSQLLGVDPSVVSLPLSLGGLGLRSATLMSRPAYWSSWADCLGMVQQRHPTVSACIVQALNHQHPSFHLAVTRLRGTVGCSWFRAQLGRTCARCPSRTSRLGC